MLSCRCRHEGAPRPRFERPSCTSSSCLRAAVSTMCMQAGRRKSNRMPMRYGDRIQIMETGDRGQILDRDCAVSGAVGDSPQRLSAVMPIPARVHFCWIGPQLSWAYAFAVLSAAAQAGMDEAVLHHTDELEE